MENSELTALIDKTSDKILDEWTAIAKMDGVEPDDYINEKLDELAISEKREDWELCKTLSGRYTKRIVGIA